MTLKEVFLMMENNFWIQQAVSFSLDYVLGRLNDKNSKKDISWQFLHCLQAAHLRTCNQLGWEYDDNVYLKVSRQLLNEDVHVCDEKYLINIFSNAVGQMVDMAAIECWINSFELELASKEHEYLREFIKVKLMIERRKIPDIQKRYLEKFQRIVFSNEKDILSLEQLYIPNSYRICNEECEREDLLELIELFIYGDLNKWLIKEKISTANEVKALFIFGYQCVGKSTLVSKIIYDHYFNSELRQKQIHVVSFSDRIFRNSDLTPYEICKYLSLDTDSLIDAVLIIDGLDESGWSDSVASTRVEELVNDLREYNCRLIITSRPNFLYTSDLLNTLDIMLLPFSTKQACSWLNNCKEYFYFNDTNRIMSQINDLSDDVKKVILIPYVFYLCVTNNIQFDQITELARLYEIIFSLDEPAFMITPYNSKPRNLRRKWLEYKEIIIEISKHVVCTASDIIPVSILNDLSQKEFIELNNVTSEFLLYRKGDGNYAFMHNSIPHYFVAKYLYSTFFSCHVDGDYYPLIKDLNYFAENRFLISASIINFIKYFVRSNLCDESFWPINLIKLFLSKAFIDQMIFEKDIFELQNLCYASFVNITRLIFAFIVPNIKPFEEFDLFSMLSHDEKKEFIVFTQMGQETMDCLRICSFVNKELNNINLQGINLRGKLMRDTSMRNANFECANLSGAYFVNSDYSLSCFDNANCKNIDFTKSVLFGCSFKNARLNGADFTDANLDYADLRGAHLNKCRFQGASLKKTKILVEQMHSMFDFDISFIRQKEMEVYLGDCLIPDEVLEEEYQKQRPVSYALNFNHNYDNSCC